MFEFEQVVQASHVRIDRNATTRRRARSYRNPISHRVHDAMQSMTYGIVGMALSSKALPLCTAERPGGGGGAILFQP